MRITTDSGRQALPIFSFEDEARMFLWFGAFDVDWSPRETSIGELTSLLYSLGANIDIVVLDPLPVPLAVLNDHVGVRRKDFMNFACNRREAN